MKLLFSNRAKSELLIDNKVFQSVVCIKDNNLYVYKIYENPYFIEEDYSLIKCFLVKYGRPDFTKEIEIYGKDLVSAD
jgi:hypothetical protein